MQKKEKKRKQKDGEATPAAAEPVAGAEKKVSHTERSGWIVADKVEEEEVKGLDCLFDGIGSGFSVARHISLTSLRLCNYSLAM